jgi:hypothetical protein
VIVQGETGVADFDALQGDLAWGRSMAWSSSPSTCSTSTASICKAPLIGRKRILSVGQENALSRGDPKHSALC